MYIDLLPIAGKYRGVTRILSLPPKMRLRQYRSIMPAYERYLDWVARQDDTYDPDVADMLLDLCAQLRSLGGACEVVGFSDMPEEFRSGGNLLGFDVFGNFRASALEEGNRIDDCFAGKLNRYGLFSDYGDALEFCEHWKRLLSSGQNPYEVDEEPRPFCVWVYPDDSEGGNYQA